MRRIKQRVIRLVFDALRRGRKLTIGFINPQLSSQVTDFLLHLQWTVRAPSSNPIVSLPTLDLRDLTLRSTRQHRPHATPSSSRTPAEEERSKK